MLEQSWNKVYLRITTKSIPLLQPEHGFCQQNELERGQLQDWYPDEKMVVLPACLNGRCCSSGAWVLYRVNKDEGDKSLPFLIFRRHCQYNFSDIFKGRQIIPEPCRNSKYPIRYLWWHKTIPGAIWTQAYSEPLQVSKMECFCVNSQHLNVVNWISKNNSS